MLPKPPYPVLLAGANVPAALSTLLSRHPSIGKVHTAIHPYQVATILRKERVDMIFVPISEWNRHLFTGIEHCNRIPDLVLVQDKEDRVDNSGTLPSDLVIKTPITGIKLRDILKAADRSSSNGSAADRYDCLWMMLEEKWRRIAITDIEVVRRIDNAQVIVCTKDADWIADHSLTEFAAMLPEDVFCIAGKLLIPAVNKHLLHKIKGYPYRNGWLQTQETVPENMLTDNE